MASSVGIDWSEIGTQWRVHEYSALRRATARYGREVEEVDALLFAMESPTPEETRRVVENAFAATDDPDGDLLLALYVYSRCLDKWEVSDDYARIQIVLDALDDVTATLRPERVSEDVSTQLLSIIVSQAQLLDGAMGVENAMNCSSPAAMGERAGRIVYSLDELLEQEQALGDGLPELRAAVRYNAAASRRYFHAIGAVADTMLAFIDLDAPGRAEFDFGPVLKVLDEAERDDTIKGGVFESELRCHRASLEALRDHAQEPQLVINEAELVYLYPFALEELDAREAVNRVLVGEVEEALVSAGLGPHNVQELALCDIWAGEPTYSGASIELPPITVVTAAGETLEFTAEVLLSRLGNHHARVWSRLENAGPHEINQALRRGSNSMGEETLTSNGRTWTTFVHYVGDVIGTIARAVGAERVDNSNSNFHIVLAARSISVQQPGGRASTAALTDDLMQALGASLLFHPVRRVTTSLEEWIRYPPPTVTNLLAQQGYARDLVVRTDNTTVMYLPASPEWVANEYEEMIEFVASMPPLLTLWENQARELTRLADARLLEVLPELGRELEDLDGSAVRETPHLDGETRMHSSDGRISALYQLHKDVIEARILESHVRRQLAFLSSPALCRTPGHRRFLDELWGAAGLPVLESRIERQLILLSERQERMAETASSIDQLIRRKRQERAERLERPVTFVLGFLAAASLAGVLQWINDAFDVDARVFVVETAVLAATVAVVVVVIVRALRVQ